MNSRHCTKIEEDDATISCQVEEYENNESFETGNQATNETMNIGQQILSFGGQQDIDILVQQPNCLMVQQHNFPIVQYSHWPTDQIGGPLSYSFGSTSDNSGQINNMENLENDFLADASLGDYDHPLQNIDDFSPCTLLMDSFGPSACDMDDLWRELANKEKLQFSGREEHI